ncbi:MAG: CPBP family intramembrane glutamic endopeptidase [Blastocatellia bacterium]
MISSSAMHWDIAVILAILAVAVPFLGRRRIRDLMQLRETTKMDRLTLYASTIGFQWLAAAVILWRVNAYGVRAAQLGLALPKPVETFSAAAVLAGLVLANQLGSLRHIAPNSSDAEGIVLQLARKVFPQDNVERLAFFALVATVAVCEEIIYRGFVQQVFDQVSGGYVVAGIVGSAMMFALAHLYQGRRGLISTFAVGLLFSIVRAWTGSLLAPITAHFVADLTVGLIAPSRLRDSSGTAIV